MNEWWRKITFFFIIIPDTRLSSFHHHHHHNSYNFRLNMLIAWRIWWCKGIAYDSHHSIFFCRFNLNVNFPVLFFFDSYYHYFHYQIIVSGIEILCFSLSLSHSLPRTHNHNCSTKARERENIIILNGKNGGKKFMKNKIIRIVEYIIYGYSIYVDRCFNCCCCFLFRFDPFWNVWLPLKRNKTKKKFHLFLKCVGHCVVFLMTFYFFCLFFFSFIHSFIILL